MSRNPVAEEPPGLRRLQVWWLELPLSYRVNALLYLLAGVAVIFLVAEVLSGDDGGPRQIQVGAPATSTTTSGNRSTVTVGPTSSTTDPGASTTTGPTAGGAGGGGGAGGSQVPDLSGLTPQAPAAGGRAGGVGDGGGGGGGSGSGSGSGGGGGGGTTSSIPPTTASPAPSCVRSADPACGPLVWSPAPVNDPIVVQVAVSTNQPIVGVDEVVFTVTVSENDQSEISDNCAQVRYGDGTGEDLPCQPPPCAPAHGTWDTPAKPTAGASRQFTFRHTYQSHGPFTPTFRFVSASKTCHDPYRSEGVNPEVTIAPTTPPTLPPATSTTVPPTTSTTAGT
jgi:hypothetical protein